MKYRARMSPLRYDTYQPKRLRMLLSPATEERRVCPSCGVFLSEPFIRCSDCLPKCCICLPCFAKGKEFGNHQNNHSYEIVRNNFILFEENWTAAEELRLLEAVVECGFGNWADVEHRVQTKSKLECELHYLQFFVYNPVPPLPILPVPVLATEVHPTPIPYTTSLEPPRPALDSAMYQEMAGYVPSRGDFATEYDNFAELDLKDLDFHQLGKDDELERELGLAVLGIYQSRLRERARRKQIIREHGLINQHGTFVHRRRYEHTLNNTLAGKLLPLCRVLTADEFDHFLEGLHSEDEVKANIKLLQECRVNGLTHLHGIPTYIARRQRRERERQQRRTALSELLNQLKFSQDEIICQQWLQRQGWKDSTRGLQDVPMSTRRSAPPLNVSGLPGFELLTPKEKELCSVIRLLPKSYLQFKTMLRTECDRQGSLRLAQARSLIKIDVNKTRKIYDLLLEDGILRKGSG